MEQQRSRRLAVILHADVAGSTALVQSNETLAHERICDVFNRFSKSIQLYGGIAHELRGDALVAEFDRASDAVCAAVAFQTENSAFNAEQEAEIHPILRIGISMGEVVVADKTITGEGVILAQRLEQIAQKGGVCIQGAACETVPKRFPFAYEGLGERTLKGFETPIRAYSVELKAGEAIPAPEPGGRPKKDIPDKPSIAVLPFTNMSGDPEQEYFSDGMTEDVITTLSYWRWFPVIARNSTFKYKGSDKGIKAIATELGARYIVEGSVRRGGTRVRISVTLIDPDTGLNLWAHRYEKDMEDIFDLQDEITKQIVASIEPKIHQAEHQRTLRKAPDNLDAWDCCLRAMSHHAKMTKKDSVLAKELLQKASELDPHFGYVKSLLAFCLYHEGVMGWVPDRQRAFESSLEAAREAVQVDHADSLGHSMLGLTYLWSRREYDLALVHTQQGVALNPSSAVGYHLLACVLEFSGYSADAVTNLNSIFSLDPYYHFKSAALADLSLAYLMLRELEQAYQCAKQSLGVMPQNVRAQQRLVSILGHMGRDVEAQAELRKLLTVQPDFSQVYLEATYAYKDPDQLKFFMEGLLAAGWDLRAVPQVS